MERMNALREQWDRVAGWTAIALGGVLLLLGWFGVSRYTLTPSQLPYVISGGLGGLFMLGLGATLLLSADLQDEWRKLDDIDRKLDRLAAAESQPASNGKHPRPAAKAKSKAAG